MGLEIVYFAGAFALLVALIYGTLSYRYRNRAADSAAEDITRRRYREQQDEAGVCSRVDRPPVPDAVPRRAGEPNGVEPAFSEDDIQREQFGPRGVKGAPDPAVMTPQRAKKTPTFIDQGHVS
jgi:hypothetical protein